jgi:hypothetical protein
MLPTDRPLSDKKRLSHIVDGLVWGVRTQNVPYDQEPSLSREEAQSLVAGWLVRNRDRLIVEAIS